MTIEEFLQGLEATGIPIQFSHFDEHPGFPYMVYMTPGGDELYADDSNYYKLEDIDLELYTDKKDPTTEQKIKTALAGMGLTYTERQSYISTERMFQKVYEVRLI